MARLAMRVIDLHEFLTLFPNLSEPETSVVMRPHHKVVANENELSMPSVINHFLRSSAMDDNCFELALFIASLKDLVTRSKDAYVNIFLGSYLQKFRLPFLLLLFLIGHLGFPSASSSDLFLNFFNWRDHCGNFDDFAMLIYEGLLFNLV